MATSVLAEIRTGWERFSKLPGWLWSNKKYVKKHILIALIILLPVVLLFILTVIFGELPRYEIRGTNRYDFYESLGFFFSTSMVVLLFSAGIVYLLRSLNWLRYHVPSYLASESPPHHLDKTKPESKIPGDGSIKECEKKFVQWFFISILAWTSFALILLMIGMTWEVVKGLLQPMLTDTGIHEWDGSIIGDYFTRIPILGDLILLFSIFPGQSNIARVSYLVASLPFAVALRNAMFFFEDLFRDNDNPPNLIFRLKIYYTCFTIYIEYIFVMSGLTTIMNSIV